MVFCKECRQVAAGGEGMVVAQKDNRIGGGLNVMRLPEPRLRPSVFRLT